MRARPLVLLALLAAAAPAGAQPAPDDEGLLVGVRAGWGVPYGDTTPDAPLEDLADGKLPLGLEIGHRFGRHVRGAFYLEFAPASLAIACPEDASCRGFDVRFGLAFELHLAPRSWLDPWLGLGFGMEHLQAETPPPGSAADAWEMSWFGLEVPIEAGLDFAISPSLTLGPYVSVTIAQFTSTSSRPPGGPTTSGGIDERATHGWVQAGLRGTLKL
jgi:hypothetical protein